MPAPAHTPQSQAPAPRAPPQLPRELLDLAEAVARRCLDLEQYQLPHLSKTRGSLANHEQLSSEVRVDIALVRRDLEELKLQADDLDKARDRRYALQHVAQIQNRLISITTGYREAVLSSKRNIDNSLYSSYPNQAGRELLSTSHNRRGSVSAYSHQSYAESVTPAFRESPMLPPRESPDTFRRSYSPAPSSVAGNSYSPRPSEYFGGQPSSPDEALMNATSDVTEGLRRTMDLMQGELDKSLVSNEMLDQQTTTMSLTSSTYDKQSSVLSKSKNLISALARADWLDRLLLLVAFSFFLLCCLWIFKRRVVDKGLHLAGALSGAVLGKRDSLAPVASIAASTLVAVATSALSSAASLAPTPVYYDDEAEAEDRFHGVPPPPAATEVEPVEKPAEARVWKPEDDSSVPSDLPVTSVPTPAIVETEDQPPVASHVEAASEAEASPLDHVPTPLRSDEDSSSSSPVDELEEEYFDAESPPEDEVAALDLDLDHNDQVAFEEIVAPLGVAPVEMLDTKLEAETEREEDPPLHDDSVPVEAQSEETAEPVAWPNDSEPSDSLLVAPFGDVSNDEALVEAPSLPVKVDDESPISNLEVTEPIVSPAPPPAEAEDLVDLPLSSTDDTSTRPPSDENVDDEELPTLTGSAAPPEPEQNTDDLDDFNSTPLDSFVDSSSEDEVPSPQPAEDAFVAAHSASVEFLGRDHAHKDEQPLSAHESAPFESDLNAKPVRQDTEPQSASDAQAPVPGEEKALEEMLEAAVANERLEEEGATSPGLGDSSEGTTKVDLTDYVSADEEAGEESVIGAGTETVIDLDLDVAMDHDASPADEIVELRQDDDSREEDSLEDHFDQLLGGDGAFGGIGAANSSREFDSEPMAPSSGLNIEAEHAEALSTHPHSDSDETSTVESLDDVHPEPTSMPDLDEDAVLSVSEEIKQISTDSPIHGTIHLAPTPSLNDEDIHQSGGVLDPTPSSVGYEDLEPEITPPPEAGGWAEDVVHLGAGDDDEVPAPAVAEESAQLSEADRTSTPAEDEPTPTFSLGGSAATPSTPPYDEMPFISPVDVEEHEADTTFSSLGEIEDARVQDVFAAVNDTFDDFDVLGRLGVSPDFPFGEEPVEETSFQPPSSEDEEEEEEEKRDSPSSGDEKSILRDPVETPAISEDLEWPVAPATDDEPAFVVESSPSPSVDLTATSTTLPSDLPSHEPEPELLEWPHRYEDESDESETADVDVSPPPFSDEEDPLPFDEADVISSPNTDDAVGVNFDPLGELTEPVTIDRQLDEVLLTSDNSLSSDDQLDQEQLTSTTLPVDVEELPTTVDSAFAPEEALSDVSSHPPQSTQTTAPIDQQREARSEPDASNDVEETSDSIGTEESKPTEKIFDPTRPLRPAGDIRFDGDPSLLEDPSDTREFTSDDPEARPDNAETRPDEAGETERIFDPTRPLRPAGAIRFDADPDLLTEPVGGAAWEMQHVDGTAQIRNGQDDHHNTDESERESGDVQEDWDWDDEDEDEEDEPVRA